MNTEIKNLYHFIELTNHRSFSLAAQAVNQTQSSLIRSIDALEKQTGNTLVNRNIKGIPLTKEGEIILEYAKEFIYKLTELNKPSITSNQNINSTISFGCDSVTSTYLVSQSISILLAKEKHKFSYIIDTLGNLNAKLIKNEIDFYVSPTFNLNFDSRYEIEELRKKSLSFYCRDDHPLSSRNNLDKYDLAKYPIATTKELEHFLKNYFRQKNFTPDITYANELNIIELTHNSDIVVFSILLSALPHHMHQHYGLTSLKTTDIPEALLPEIDHKIIRLKEKTITEGTKKLINTIKNADSKD